MNFSQRIQAVFHGETPDRVPFVPYAHLIPRGEFGREMRDRGMGLLVGCNVIWRTQPNVRVETRTEGDVSVTLYHTPAGTVSSSERTHVGRIADGGTVHVDRLIRKVEDYAPVIFMIEDTEFHLDRASYENTVRDLGGDGLVRSAGLTPPYLSSMRYFSLENWSYTQYDHPTQFARLLSALERQQEKLLPLVLQSPVELLVCGSTHDGYGPDRYREHALPFYKRIIPQLQVADKICSIHAHNSQLRLYAGLLAETGVQVIEAYTPPPISDLPIEEARAMWGDETVIWVNFPETLFWYGVDETRDYTLNLLESDPRPERLVLGMTEMGTYGVTDDESERVFQAGVRAIMDAIDIFAGL
jgi:hypothetical protein